MEHFDAHLRYSVSGMSVNVNKAVTSVVVVIAVPKPPSQVAISCSGRVSMFYLSFDPARHLFLGSPVRVTYSDHG